MKLRSWPFVDRLSATSDLDEKLVTTWSPAAPEWPVPSGTRSVLITCPDEGLSWSRKIGEVMPKLESTPSLFQTPGYEPSLFAVTQLVVQPGGSCVTPGCSKPAEPTYTERLTTKLPGKNHGLSLARA